MSWSFAAIGTPEKVKTALRQAVQNYAPAEGKSPSQSYIEFSEAEPHLAGLLDQCFDRRSGQNPPVVHIDANGSGQADGGGTQMERSVSISIKKLYAPLL